MIPAQATIAVNPLQWFATADGDLDWSQSPPLPELMAEVKRAGFDAVHTRIPAGTSAAEYGRIVRDAGLEPAPGTTPFGLPEDGTPAAETLRTIGSLATAYAELGLAEVFVLPAVRADGPRMADPARGAQADPARLDRIVDLLIRVGEVAVAEGVLPLLHPHVGAWVETAAETRYLLDRVAPALLGFGPDVGHLSWAGADPVELIGEYRPRVAGVHLKDLRRAVAEESKAIGRSYQETAVAGLWIEPGRGDFDYEPLWDALGPDFDGTLVVEVDRGDLQPPFESVRASAQWVARQRAAVGAADR